MGVVDGHHQHLVVAAMDESAGRRDGEPMADNIVAGAHLEDGAKLQLFTAAGTGVAKSWRGEPTWKCWRLGAKININGHDDLLPGLHGGAGKPDTGW